MRFIVVLTILLSFGVQARTLIKLPDSHNETITLAEARAFIDTSKLKADEESNVGWLAFDVTKGIKSRETKSAHVSLFSNQSEITNFGISADGISNSEGLKRIIAFPLNSNIVTHIEVKFYCSENYIYNLEVELNAL